MLVSVIGLGKLGKPLVQVMQKNNLNVLTYDINNEGTHSFEECAKADNIFIVVPTNHDPEYDGSNITSHLPPKDFDYSIVKQVFFSLNEYLKITQNVILVSTVLPGTIKQLKPLIKCNLYYSPFLISLDTVKYDIINPEFVMIGGNDGKVIETLYKKFTLCSDFVHGTYEEIEVMKIFYNTFLSLKITFANAIQDVAMKVGNVDVDKITNQFAKVKSLNSNLFLKAGLSAGGPCLPRDVIAMKWFAEQYNMGYDLFGSLRNMQEAQTKNLAKYLMNLSELHNLPIVVLGKEYKEGVDYEYGSPSVLLSRFVNCTFDDISNPAVFLVTNRKKYTFPEGSVVVDINRQLKNSIHYGNSSNILDI